MPLFSPDLRVFPTTDRLRLQPSTPARDAMHERVPHAIICFVVTGVCGGTVQGGSYKTCVC